MVTNDDFTAGMNAAAKVITEMADTMDSRLNFIANHPDLSPRAKLYAARYLIPLHEQLKTEHNKLTAMARAGY